MRTNNIVSWFVRVPGQTTWVDGLETEADARREADAANRIAQPGHEVFAVHKNGDITGPYHKEHESCKM